MLRLRKVAAKAEKDKQSIVFLPCHRSHVDYVSLQIICYRLGLALPTVVSGDNLNFPVVGSFLQHAGKKIAPYMTGIADTDRCHVHSKELW